MTRFLPLVLLLAVSGIAVGQSCEGILADTLAHPSDCRFYYNLYLMSCPNGELYNTQTRRCSPAAESQCGQTTSNTIPTEETSSTGSSSTTSSWGSTGTTVSTAATTTGTTITTTMGGSSTTTQSTGSTTTGVTTNVPTEGSTTPRPPRFECPAVDDPAVKIRYSHDSDCELYYLCVSGSATLYKCTTGSHFSPTKKTCRLVEEAACDRCPVAEVARLQHESVCAYYYRCEEGLAVLFACPEPLEFSRSERVCVEPEDSWCTLEDVVSSSTSASSTIAATLKL